MERSEREFGPGSVTAPPKSLARPLSSQAAREKNAEERIRSLLWRYQPEFVLAGSLEILFTRNSSTLVSLSQRKGHGTLRLHVLFSSAPAGVLEDVIRFCFTCKDQAQSKILRSRILDYVGENRNQAIATVTRPVCYAPEGSIYDLEEILWHVIREYVPERRLKRTRPSIGWSKRATTELMGKWIETPREEANIIVINRLLDDERVPSYYIEYIVYHELLHDLFSISRSHGRWVKHSPEFQTREKTYPLYARAREWETRKLHSLSTSENAAK